MPSPAARTLPYSFCIGEVHFRKPTRFARASCPRRSGRINGESPSVRNAKHRQVSWLLATSLGGRWSTEIEVAFQHSTTSKHFAKSSRRLPTTPTSSPLLIKCYSDQQHPPTDQLISDGGNTISTECLDVGSSGDAMARLRHSEPCLHIKPSRVLQRHWYWAYYKDQHISLGKHEKVFGEAEIR